MKKLNQKLAVFALTAAMCTGIGYVDATRGGILNVAAEGIGDWIQTVNGSHADANGNVDVTTVNGHTVAVDVPSTAKFTDTIYDASALQTQADQNAANITAIENKLSGLTATAENVASGYTFVGSGGTIATGTLNTSSDDYSTEETVIGTWIDGKPIYRKVYTGLGELTFARDEWLKISSIPATGMDRIVSARAFRTSDMSSLITSAAIRDGYIHVNSHTLYDFSILLLEYTKTSD